MNRTAIVNIIGTQYLQSNIENEEFSYQKALKVIGKDINDFYSNNARRKYKNLDLRFSDDKLSVLIETKNNFDKWNQDEIFEQLQHYVDFEKELTGNKVIAIIANTDDDRTLMWQGDNIEINDVDVIRNKPILPFEEYQDVYFGAVNNKNKVIQSTYDLNEILHETGINEKIRSQFVGTCLLALKNGLNYNGQSTYQIIGGIEEILTNLLEKNLNKAEKLAILKTKVLESQDVKNLSKEEFQKILTKINSEILPFINDSSTMGQDLLNLFFALL